MVEVKKEYKMTELGVIPEDWDIKRLGDIFDFKNGLNKEKSFFGYGTPIVNYMDVYKLSGLKGNDIKGKVFLNPIEMKAYDVRQGDVLFTRTSETQDEIGLSSVILDDIKDTVFSGFVLRGREKLNCLDVTFKKYCFRTHYLRKQIMSTSSYTTRALTNGKLLSEVIVIFPQYFKEQQAIAQALSDTDSLISSLEKLIDKKKNIKQGTMQELLTGRKRVEGFCGEWEEKRLGDIGETIIGLTYSPRDIVKSGGKLVLRSSNIKNSKLVYEDNVFVNKDISENIVNRENDILICVRNGSRNLIGKSALLTGKAVGETFGAFMSIYRSPYNKFINYLFQSSIIKKQIDEHLGATINQITNKSLNSFKIFLPSEEEQTAIANILSDMDKEIEALEQKLDKFKSIKEGMMQELLTGRIRFMRRF